MTLTIKDEVRRSFELAALRKEAEHIRTPRQWKEAKELRARCDEVREHINAVHRRTFEKRVGIARQRIIDEAGRWDRVLRPYDLGTDRFAIEDTLRQAQREVRDAHQRRLDRVDDFEHAALRRLTEDFRRENDIQGQARNAFTLAIDRRETPDRRDEFERRRSVQRIE